MNKKPFIRAEEGKPPGISVEYYDADGNKMIRYHEKNGKVGTHAWRNTNPGNLVYGDGSHAKQTGGIGKAKGRIAFPDYATGKQSMRLLLKKDFYQPLTLNELPRKYTGVPANKPDTKEVEDYRKAIRVQWCSKDTAIALAEERRLHAIIVHAKKGIYLRPEFHAKAFRYLVC